MMGAQAFTDVVDGRFVSDIAWSIFVDLAGMRHEALVAVLPLLVRAYLAGSGADAGTRFVHRAEHHSRSQPRDQFGHFTARAALDAALPGLGRVDERILRIWWPLLGTGVGCCGGGPWSAPPRLALRSMYGRSSRMSQRLLQVS